MIARPPRSTLFPYTTPSDLGVWFAAGVILSPARMTDTLEGFYGCGLPFITPGGIHALQQTDRKSTRLNSSHQIISYAVFCLKKKNKHISSQHEKEEHYRHDS